MKYCRHWERSEAIQSDAGLLRCAPNDDSGFILLVVLIFMLILSSLSLLNLSQMRQGLRIQSMTNTADAKFSQARTLARRLAQHPSCFIPLTPVTDLMHKSTDWWQTHGCSADSANIRYHYSFEDLGKDACAVTVEGRNVAYYRLTVVSAAKLVQDTNVFLQTTLLRIAKSPEQCQGQKHIVTLGEQVLREI